MRTDPNHLPDRCGVYLFRASDGEVLYVGKAIDIRSRIRSHLADRRNPKEERLREATDTIDWILTSSELEALVLEDTLIKRHRPRYNVRLKDDKSYPYIAVTREDFPSVHQIRGIHPEMGDHYGPHGDPVAVRRSLRWIRKVFPVRSCRRDMGRVSRPCLEHHIGRCLAPCTGQVDRDVYSQAVRGLREFLAGRGDDLLEHLDAEMWRASTDETYEKAALIRDVIHGLKRMLEGQKVVLSGSPDMDFVSFSGDRSSAALLMVRRGRVIDVVKFALEGGDPLGSPIEGTLSSLYAISGQVPPRVVLDPFDLDPAARKDLETFLSAKRGGAVTIKKARGNDQRAILDMTRKNAEEKARSRVHDLEGQEVLNRLKAALDLPDVPSVIECFDVSHLSGTGTVASMVQFVDGRPRKTGYRRFRIRAEGNDDYASMKEAVGRRYRRLLDHDDPLPDLILIDGGKGQLGAAMDALREQGVPPHQPIASLAKREEEVFLPDRRAPVAMRRDDPALRLLQRVRDEAHRFAITYQRGLRGTDASLLTGIEGIGKARYLRIAREFSSLSEMLEAGAEGISRRCGIPMVLAEKVVDHLASEPLAGRSYGKDVSKP